MKIVDIGKSLKVTMIRLDGTEEVTEHTVMSVVKQALDLYPPMGKGFKQIKQALKIHEVLDGVNGEKMFRLEDADWEICQKAMDEADWAPRFIRQAYPLVESFLNAQTVDGKP